GPYGLARTRLPEVPRILPEVNVRPVRDYDRPAALTLSSYSCGRVPLLLSSALGPKQAYDNGHFRNGAGRRLMARTAPRRHL
ncbi:MAG: hypothetical protein ABIG44_04140, partial [Planctomycetota bacterium]